MKFDIKDIKSWASRNDVKIGAMGYFSNQISDLYRMKDTEVSKIECIYDDRANCFSSNDFYVDFSFFLPLNAVKKDEPEIKYRPFKNLYEFYQFLSFNSHITEKDFTPIMLLGLYFKYREKKALRVASTIVINRIDVDLKGTCEPIIEGRNFERWFDLAEIMNNDCEWQPFGVKENEQS